MAQSEPIHTKFPQPVDDFPALARRAREEDEELSGLLIRDLQLEREDLSGLVLQDVDFDHCRLPDCDWFGTSFSDVTFHTCDLSGGNFENSYWLRFACHETKALGVRLQNCRMRRGLLEQGRFSAANWNQSRLREVRFSSSALTGSFFSRCTFTGVEFQQCDLNQVNFFHTPLEHVDLTTCTIDVLVLSEHCDELKGAVVDLYQAAELSRRMGLVVKL